MENKLTKWLHWLFYVGFIVFAGVFIYHISCFPCKVTAHYYGTLIMTIILYILQEMTIINNDKEKQQLKETRGLGIILLLVVLSFMILLASGCSSRKGYGCPVQKSAMACIEYK